MPEEISEVHKLVARYAHQKNIDFIFFKVARLKGGVSVFSTNEEYKATGQYYQTLKQSTQTPHEHVYTDVENIIDITSMIKIPHQSCHQEESWTVGGFLPWSAQFPSIPCRGIRKE